MKPFLLLAAATGFLPVLIVKVLCQEPLDRVSYESVRTDHLTVQSEIVNLHNALRRKVQPTAGNMLKMSWEEDAAANARELSKFCEEGESNAFQRRIKSCLGYFLPHWLWCITMLQKKVTSIFLCLSLLS
uniref:Cysteine rich secretory protein 1 n=1 Tax=Molossus molossus TaxID=27622 RepID=A0A7J8GPT5_MOLMO|nr:cysteine rich secretory protein 1 [Molossus molossus]